MFNTQVPHWELTIIHPRYSLSLMISEGLKGLDLSDHLVSKTPVDTSGSSVVLITNLYRDVAASSILYLHSGPP